MDAAVGSLLGFCI